MNKIIIDILRDYPSGWDDSNPEKPEEKWYLIKQDENSYHIYVKSIINKIIPIKKTHKAINYFKNHEHICNLQPIIHRSPIDLSKDIINPRAMRITDEDRRIANELYGNKIT